MKSPFKKHIFSILFFMIPIMLFSANQEEKVEDNSDTLNMKTFILGEVEVYAEKKTEMNGRVSNDYMEQHNKFEVSQSINMLPGVNITSSGQRNESMVAIRGFDLKAVPVYMDGIPVYVPYDGYVDLARFTTFDLSAIDISKGFSSLLYGPNSLGGAINLISRKPYKKLEYDGALGMINTNGYRGNINIGSRLDKIYFQGGYSYLHRDAYTMSRKFNAHTYENGGERDNSYRTDQKINFKMGWTPKDKHEYVLGYMFQKGEKGTPVYAGDDTLNSLYKKPRYWQWPKWNKTTYYFMSNTSIGKKNYIKSRIYYDVFKNVLNSYDDATYSTQEKGYAFESRYNDFTYGASIEYGTTLIPKNDLKLSLQIKKDVHREHNVGEPVTRFDDLTMNIAIEDVYKVTDKWMLIPGVSLSSRRNTHAEDYNSSTNTISEYVPTNANIAVNGQLGVFYYVKDLHRISFTTSLKTRFATIKDRYSYRMGSAIPNPDLQPELSYNSDITYRGKYFEKLSVEASLFYSRIQDAILNVNNVVEDKFQTQNAGKAAYYGLEVFAKYEITPKILLSANYTFIKRNNLSNPDIKFTDIPRSKLFSFIQYEPISALRLMVSAEFNSSRFSTSYGVQTPKFVVFNTLISSRVCDYISLEAGVNNILDKNYYLTEGYPEEGRNLFLTLRFFNPI